VGGRKREPVSLIRLKGKSNFSEAYLREKEAKEINVEPKELEVPNGLNETQRQLFLETYNDLLEYDMATHMEIGLITRYVKAKHEYDRLSEQIENMEVDEVYVKLLNARLRVSEEIRKCEGDLGLNVFARMKIDKPQREEKEQTKAEQLFGEL
jgi:phage terminase small subunit